MTVVAVGSVRGAPGATTLALALAAVAAASGPSLLVEADPAGGVLAARCPALRGGPGLEALAYPRQATDPRTVAQPLGAVDVVVAPYDPWAVTAALTRARTSWAEHVREATGPVVIDVGRLVPGSASEPFVLLADLVVVVLHADGADALAAGAHVERLREEGRRDVRLVTGGRGEYDRRRLAHELGPSWVVHLAHDARGVDLLQRGATAAHRRLARSPLLRAAAAVAAAVEPVTVAP